MKSWTEVLAPQLCDPFRGIVAALGEGNKKRIQELRIRAGQPFYARADADVFLCADGICGMERAFVPGQADITRLLEAMCRHSLYAYEEDIRRGFLTLRGGFRVGLVGHSVTHGGEMTRLHPVGAINIRIAREIHGAAQGIARHLLSPGGVRSTLIVSAPGLGKTTMLRDAVRIVSEAGYSVALADERGEVAALYEGVPQMDVGPRTDVLDGCPKDVAFSMLLRAMSPRALATDELGGPRELDAIKAAASSGVAVLATAHAASYREVAAHPSLSSVLPCFERVVELSGAPGRVHAVYADGVRVSG